MGGTVVAKLNEVRKALVAVVSLASALIAYQFADAPWAASLLGLLGVVGVYLTKNETPSA